MADKLDDILKYTADCANAQVDYTAMHARVLNKAHAKKRAMRRNVIRYGSMAAAAVLLVTVGLSALSQDFGINKMRGRSNDSAFYAGEQPQENEAAPQDAAGAQTIVGSAPNPEGETAGGDYGSASVCEEITPPPGCSVALYDTLYWQQQGLELPAVSFGGCTSVESDGEHYLLTVTGATAADYEAYIALICGMYPGSVFGAEDIGCVGKISSSGEVMDGQYHITVSLAGDVLTVNVQTN